MTDSGAPAQVGRPSKSGEGICSADMRIWDLPVECLCRNHLLAEHRELHAVWSIIVNEKSGYSKHPEVMRWRGRLGALWTRHEAQVREMTRRGYRHRSPLDLDAVPRDNICREQTVLVDSIDEQRTILRAKGCSCRMSKRRG